MQKRSMQKKSMLKKVVKLVLDMVIALLLLLFILSFLYFIHGSFEDFPKEEQQSEIRTVTAMLMIMSGVPCMICTYLRVRLRKKSRDQTGS